MHIKISLIGPLRQTIYPIAIKFNVNTCGTQLHIPTRFLEECQNRVIFQPQLSAAVKKFSCRIMADIPHVEGAYLSSCKDL